jgi:mono/diheme cytochrome c family protein
MRLILTTLTIVTLSAAVALAADAKAGQATFEKSCKTCHGADGTPNANIAKMMKVEIKDLKSPEVQAMSDTHIKQVISEGKDKMKPVKAVTGGDADNVVAYIRTLKK